MMPAAYPPTTDPQIQYLIQKLSIEQLKVESMLELTQSFNLNFSSNTVLEIYRYIISEKFKIPDFALYLADDNNRFYIATQHHKAYTKLPPNPAELLKNYQKTETLTPETQVFFGNLRTVVPVIHKKQPLAYLLLSKLPWASDALVHEMLNYFQSITNIVVMGNENKKLFKNKVEKETLQNELKVARAVQDLLVPQDLPNTDSFKASAIYMPNNDVGGDYFDFQQLSPHEWIFCIADVVGKGVPAALFMANVQANMRLLIDTHISLQNLVEQLAAKVYKNTQGEKYVTMFIAKINTQTGSLEYVNAGHVQPFICHQNGDLERLKCGTIPLGIEAVLPFLNVGNTTLPQGSLLLAFTDGVSEITNAKGTMYEHEMLEKYVRKNALLSPVLFNQKLLENMKKFSHQTHFDDDVTVLTLRCDQLEM